MWVKICGVRDEQTAEQICRLSPDAIGLNFYAGSPRAVTKNVAARIADISADRAQRVGVFVNHSPGEIEELVGGCRLDAVQVHGDESPQTLADIAARVSATPLYRAWRMDGESLADLSTYFDECRKLGVKLAGCLVDSRVKGAYGGTGHAVPWDALAREYQGAIWPPLILAGGLNAANVGTAIGVVKPWGVDVASGVESSPGIKDLNQVRQFIENARKVSASQMA